MRLLNFVAGIVALIGATCSAQASVYNFTIDSVDYDLVGQITTSGNLITSISGQVTGLLDAPITGLQGQPNIYFSNDNLIDPFSAPFVSNEGILFDARGFSSTSTPSPTDRRTSTTSPRTSSAATFSTIPCSIRAA